MVNFDDIQNIVRQGPETWNEWRAERLEVAVDFSGVDFTLRQNEEISFRNFAFGTDVSFSGAKFGDQISFANTVFGERTNFADTTFGNEASFNHADFKFGADFTNATFGQNADFRNSRFRDHAFFEDTIFENAANFTDVAFLKMATFENVTFSGTVLFGNAGFYGLTTFENAKFGDSAWFERANFDDDVSFENATFSGMAHFDGPRQAERANVPNQQDTGTYFQSISFSHARFKGLASFNHRAFRDDIDFSNAYFANPPDFRATSNWENLDWTGTRFEFQSYAALGKIKLPVRRWTAVNDTVTRLRRLRGIAKEIHAVDAELNIFILERQAERGILWHDWWFGISRSRLFGWWRPLTVTTLMLLYSWTSNCGRSVILPLVWLSATNWGFWLLYTNLIDRPLFIPIKKALFDLTFASAVPFGATSRPAYRSAVELLFQKGIDGPVNIPWQFQVASATQSIVNLVLVFLLGLALRNYFKFR